MTAEVDGAFDEMRKQLAELRKARRPEGDTGGGNGPIHMPNRSAADAARRQCFAAMLLFFEISRSDGAAMKAAKKASALNAISISILSFRGIVCP